MKITLILALVATALAIPAPGPRGRNPNPAPAPAPAPAAAPAPQAAPAAANTGAINLSLIPAFGLTAGIPSTNQVGSCQGANGKNIPCKCPPNVNDFAARIALFNSQGNAQGTAFNFPTNAADQSPATQLARVNACIVALQNFDNTAPGVGCPAVSAPNFGVVQAALQKQI